MALEPITRQEKIIAGQDLTPITRMEKFLKQFGGGGGGLPSGGAPYQQLVTDGEGNAKWEDRMCYSEGFYITWDGDTTGLVQVNNMYYKVSDKVFTVEELIGAEASFCHDGYTGKNVVTENMIKIDGANIFLGTPGLIVSVAEPFGAFESTGTYFIKRDEESYFSCIQKGKVIPVDTPFLPLNYRVKFTLTPGDVITVTCNATYYQLLNYVRSGDPIHATIFYQNGGEIVSAIVNSIEDRDTGGLAFNFNGTVLLNANVIFYDSSGEIRAEKV